MNQDEATETRNRHVQNMLGLWDTAGRRAYLAAVERAEGIESAEAVRKQFAAAWTWKTKGL